MQYQAEINSLQPILSQAKSILIALKNSPTVDDLAAGLSLYLALGQSQKQVQICSDGEIRVLHTNLFGVDKIAKKVSSGKDGDFKIALGGVVAPDGGVPALSKLDWAPSGSDLNLVFHVLPGQKFEPTHVTPSYEGSGFDLVFVVGASSLAQLGSVYLENTVSFTPGKIVNIDNKGQNSAFGSINFIDTEAAAVCQIMARVLTGLQLPLAGDIATNLLTGIYDASQNLQADKVSAETFNVVAEAISFGGMRPGGSTSEKPVSSTAATQTSNDIFSSPGIDLSKIFQAPAQAFNFNPSPPPAPPSQNSATIASIPTNSFSFNQPLPASNQPSPEEVPSGEDANSASPELDWLTPKIYKGSGVG